MRTNLIITICSIFIFLVGFILNVNEYQKTKKGNDFLLENVIAKALADGENYVEVPCKDVEIDPEGQYSARICLINNEFYCSNDNYYELNPPSGVCRIYE